MESQGFNVLWTAQQTKMGALPDQLLKLAVGTWNVTPLVAKQPELLWDPQYIVWLTINRVHVLENHLLQRGFIFCRSSTL